MSKKKLFVIDTISTFRMRYVVKAKNINDAYDEVVMRDSGNPDDAFDEVSQKHLGEQIVDGREISKDEFYKMLTELEQSNDESASTWLGKELIRKVQYGEV